jgi:hypothetical protein
MLALVVLQAPVLSPLDALPAGEDRTQSLAESSYRLLAKLAGRE